MKKTPNSVFLFVFLEMSILVSMLIYGESQHFLVVSLKSSFGGHCAPNEKSLSGAMHIPL